MTSSPDNVARGTGSTMQATAQDVTWTRFVIAVLKYPRTLVGVPLFLTLAVVAAAFLLPHDYAVDSTFLPEGASQQSGLSALATQFGFQTQVGGGADSPDFYTELLESEQLLKEAALTTYRFVKEPSDTDTLSGTIIDLYEIEGDTQDARTRSAIQLLRNRVISTDIDRSTNVVTLETTTPWLGLSRQLNQRLLDLVNQFNVHRRQSRASAERRFVEGRLQDAHDSLRAAEDTLQQFWARNRGFQASQQLSFEASRLQRQVDLRQDLYVTLSRSYEQARIDEVRNTPVITVIDPPEYPQPLGRRLIRHALMALFAGFGLAVGIALLAEFVQGMRQRRPGDFEEMGRRARAALGALVPWARNRG